METRTSSGSNSRQAGFLAGFLAFVILTISAGCGSKDQSSQPESGKPNVADKIESLPQDAGKPATMPTLPEDPRKRAVIGVRYVSFGMMLFNSHVGRLPTEAEGVAAVYEEPESLRGMNKWQGPYNDPAVVKADPWGRPYHYRVDASLKLGFEVWSDGPNAAQDSDDIIASRDAELPSFMGAAEGARPPRGAGSPQESGHEERPVVPNPIPGDQNQPK